MRADVVIVGGGPAGCFAGEALAKEGFDVVIAEEHGEVGNPSCCTGILGISGLRELGIKPGRWALGKLRRAIFYPPSNKPIELTRGRVEALVVDRVAFDRDLARRAVNAGATLLPKSRCVDLKLGREPRVKLKGINEVEFKARLVVGADGSASTIARKAGLLKVARYLKCAQMETFAELRSDTVELYFGNSLAPGFFAWLTPAGEFCRAGLGTCRGGALRKLRSFVEAHPVASRKIKQGKMLTVSTGLIPEPLSRKICTDRVMLVGDAAGHVKPLTGGGIYIGLSCARLAVEAAVAALEGEPTVKTLREYERAVARKFGREFELEIRARRIFERIPDGGLNSIFGLLAMEDVREFVLKHADFDHHSKLIQAFIGEGPKLLRSLGLTRVLKYLHYLKP